MSNKPTSLQQRLDAGPDPLSVLRGVASKPPATAVAGYAPAYTHWRDEQAAWATTAVLFDQTSHMTDLYIEGPDTVRLLSETAVNSFASFGAGRAKQYVAVNEDGQYVADGILFGLDDGRVNLVALPSAANWVQFHGERGGYDVEFTRDERIADSRSGRRLTYRFEVQGPAAWEILEAAHGGPIDPIPFFGMGEFTIAGRTVTALNHTMIGVPGDPHTGLELFGPIEDHDAVVERVLASGAPLGLVRGGAVSYISTTIESGWYGGATPAIYTDPRLRDFREWLDADGYEAGLAFNGSYDPAGIEGYYLTPWDLGYGRTIRFDHDFIGRDALERLAATNRRRKAWLYWEDADVERVIRSSYFDAPSHRARSLDAPVSFSKDSVRAGDVEIGYSFFTGYTVNQRKWSSLATIDEESAPDGSRVELIWGIDAAGPRAPHWESHTPTEITAEVRWAPITR